MKGGIKRLATAAVLVPAMLLSYFVLPPLGFVVLCLVVVSLALVEYIRIVKVLVPGAPLAALHVLVPALALALSMVLMGGVRPDSAQATVAAVGIVGAVLMGTIVLLGRTPIGQVLPTLGALAFGLPYFAVPVACLGALKADDPWLIFLLSAIVFLGDTGAYYAGSAWGRHKLAPVVSPKKSWEGAIASIVTALVATAVWSYFRLGHIGWELLAVAVVTSVVAQIGDLVESLIKREANIKDSGGLLPGHGGMLDRLDAFLFAAPVFYGAVHTLGVDRFLP